MTIAGIKGLGVPAGLPGPHTGILVADSAPQPLAVTMGLAGLNPSTPFSLNSLWVGHEAIRPVSADRPSLPNFYVQLNRMKQSQQEGGIVQGLEALVGNT